jgi:hypothetical protein
MAQPAWRTSSDLEKLLGYEVNISPDSTTLSISETGGEASLNGQFILKTKFYSTWFAESVPEGEPAKMRLNPKKLGVTEVLKDEKIFNATHYPQCPVVTAPYVLTPEKPVIKKLEQKNKVSACLDKEQVTWEMAQYQVTQRYSFDMPMLIDASKLPFDRYEIRMQLGFKPFTVRGSSGCRDAQDTSNPSKVELDIPGLKLETPDASKKPNFYPYPSLIYKK